MSHAHAPRKKDVKEDKIVDVKRSKSIVPYTELPIEIELSV